MKLPVLWPSSIRRRARRFGSRLAVPNGGGMTTQEPCVTLWMLSQANFVFRAILSQERSSQDLEPHLS